MTPKWYLAPSLAALRREIDEAWPNRSRASDGTIGNTAHSKVKSDHNPDPMTGVVRAFDITENGISHLWVRELLVGHEAVEYVINDSRIWSRVRDFKPIPYTGLNAHEHHIHVSLRHTKTAENWAGRWLPREDETMTEDDRKWVKAQIDAAATRVNDYLSRMIDDVPRATVDLLLRTSIETYFDKNDDGRRDRENVAQALAGGHSDAWLAREQLERVEQLLTALAADVRKGE